MHPKQPGVHSLTALRDGDEATCAEINLTPERGALLNGSIYPAYSVLYVSVLVSGAEVIFGPSSDPTQCATVTSLLLTHDTSKRVADGDTCGPICDVPGACLIKGRKTVRSKEKWYFTCVCPRNACNELLLSLQSTLGWVSVCEIMLEKSDWFPEHNYNHDWWNPRAKRLFSLAVKDWVTCSGTTCLASALLVKCNWYLSYYFTQCAVMMWFFFIFVRWNPDLYSTLVSTVVLCASWFIGLHYMYTRLYTLNF